MAKSQIHRAKSLNNLFLDNQSKTVARSCARAMIFLKEGVIRFELGLQHEAEASNFSGLFVNWVCQLPKNGLELYLLLSLQMELFI
jgi:hypothetical protein